MEPTLLALARVCLEDYPTLGSERVQAAIRGLSPEVLAEVADPAWRPDHN